MKKRFKIIVTTAMLAFSLALMAFGVYAASSHTLGVQNFVSFDIEDNISVSIIGKTAIGADPLPFNSAPSTNIIEASASIGANGLTATQGTLTSGVWTPWTSSSPASLDIENDTVYWIFKVQNTGAVGANSATVKVTNSEGQFLSGPYGYDCQVMYGTSATQVPQYGSLSLEPQQIGYILVSLTVIDKAQNISKNTTPWTFKITVEKPQSYAYFRTDWVSTYINAKESLYVSEVHFTGGDGKPYAGQNDSETITLSLGATDINGYTPLENETADVKQITGYLNGSVLTIHSPAKIYAPMNCDELFKGTLMGGGYNLIDVFTFDNFDTSKVMSMYFMFADQTTVSSLDLSKFDTSSCINMNSMFMGCSNLEYLNVSSFDTTNVSDFKNMILNTPKIQKLDLSSFYISSTANVTWAFLPFSMATEECSLIELKTPYYIGQDIWILPLGLGITNLNSTHQSQTLTK